jgi:hypothetical protein
MATANPFERSILHQTFARLRNTPPVAVSDKSKVTIPISPKYPRRQLFSRISHETQNASERNRARALNGSPAIGNLRMASSLASELGQRAFLAHAIVDELGGVLAGVVGVAALACFRFVLLWGAGLHASPS